MQTTCENQWKACKYGACKCQIKIELYHTVKLIYLTFKPTSINKSLKTLLDTNLT